MNSLKQRLAKLDGGLHPDVVVIVVNGELVVTSVSNPKYSAWLGRHLRELPRNRGPIVQILEDSEEDLEDTP
jgi:hypothetical protein